MGGRHEMGVTRVATMACGYPTMPERAGPCGHPPHRWQDSRHETHLRRRIPLAKPPPQVEAEDEAAHSTDEEPSDACAVEAIARCVNYEWVCIITRLKEIRAVRTTHAPLDAELAAVGRRQVPWKPDVETCVRTIVAAKGDYTSVVIVPGNTPNGTGDSDVAMCRWADVWARLGNRHAPNELC